MPHETIFEDKGIYCRFYGELTYQDVFMFNEEAWGRSDWSHMKYQIIGYLEVESIKITKDEATLIAHMDTASSRSSETMKVAMLAVEGDMIELCTDYISALKPDDWEAKIFGTLEEARAWVE